jgi:hypothetical protein
MRADGSETVNESEPASAAFAALAPEACGTGKTGVTSGTSAAAATINEVTVLMTGEDITDPLAHLTLSPKPTNNRLPARNASSSASA